MAGKEKKKALERKARASEAPASAKLIGYSSSARRIRVVADKIRGKSLAWALDYLRTERKKAATPLRQVLDSAMANADVKGATVDNLMVTEVRVDKGAIRKRFMPRAQGRATKIRKQTSHIEVVLSDNK